MCERPLGVFTLINPATLSLCIMWPVQDQMKAALALVLMICLHPGNLLAPWKMPQRISSSVTACGGSVCESPPHRAPTGPLIPRVANSFWLAISQPSLSAAIAAGDEAVRRWWRRLGCTFTSVCVWFCVSFRVEGHCMSDRCCRPHLQQATLLLIKVAGVVVPSSSFRSLFVTRLTQIRRRSRQNNNTQRLDAAEAREVKPCKIALTEPEGKTVILRSPSTTRSLSPPPPTLACLLEGGELYYRPPPSYDESSALRRLARPTSICGRLDPLITMPATSHH